MPAQRARRRGEATGHARPPFLKWAGRAGAARHAVIRLPDLSAKGPVPPRREPHAPLPASMRQEPPASRVPGRLAEAWQLARLLVVLLTAGEDQREIAAHRVIYVMSGKARRPAPSLITRLTLLLAMLAMPRVASAQAARVITPTEMFDLDPG